MWTRIGKNIECDFIRTVLFAQTFKIPRSIILNFFFKITAPHTAGMSVLFGKIPVKGLKSS